MTDLTTPWTGHWREGEYLAFVRWALAEEPLRRQYTEATADAFEPAADGALMGEQIQSGEALAWLTRYADWLARNVFGMPDDAGEPVVMGRTMH
ncbi:MAG: hypothetical protein ACK4P4_09160 [Allorhizobium sp.]